MRKSLVEAVLELVPEYVEKLYVGIVSQEDLLLAVRELENEASPIVRMQGSARIVIL